MIPSTVFNETNEISAANSLTYFQKKINSSITTNSGSNNNNNNIRGSSGHRTYINPINNSASGISSGSSNKKTLASQIEEGVDNSLKSFPRNLVKIRQYDTDVSPRPRRQYQNDPSSRYCNKGDDIGQGQTRITSGDNNATLFNRNLASNEEGGEGARFQQQQHYNRQQYRNSVCSNSATEPISNSSGGRLNHKVAKTLQFANNGSTFVAPRFENNRNKGLSGRTNDSLLSANNVEFRKVRGEVKSVFQRSESFDQRFVSALKTETIRQSGPESTAQGRESPVVSSPSRRWIPPSLRPQYGLTQKDKNDAIFRKVRGILNKLTPEKFQELSDDLLKINLNSAVILKGVIHLLFEKALDEPKYSCMYAQLCKRLSEEAPNFDSPSKTCTFVRLLLNVCEDKFINRSNCMTYHNGPLTPEEEEKRHVAKQRMLGNVKFIGELHKLSMLSTDVLHRCIQELLDKRNSNATIQDRCEDMECLCQLIRTCGKNLDTEKGKRLMDQYFEKMDQRSKSQKYPARIRFMLRDIIELRENNWVPRKVGTTEGPVPIRQIRTDDDNLIRSSYINRRDMRNNERDNDSWMNRFSLNLQPGYNDLFSSLSVSNSSHINSSMYNSNSRHYNQRNNQNSANFSNRFNKHNQHNQHNNSHSVLSYTNVMMINKDLAPRFKRNLITASQDPVENLQMRPAANSLLFKANVNIKTPTMLPISTPPPSNIISTNSSSSGVTSPTSVSPIPQRRQKKTLIMVPSTITDSSSQVSIPSNLTSLNLRRISSLDLIDNNGKNQGDNKIFSGLIVSGNSGTEKNTLNTNTIIKSEAAEKPQKQKKDKGLTKEEVSKRILTFLYENLMINEEGSNDKNIDDIVNKFYDIKVPDKFWKDAFVLILNEIIDKSDTLCQRCIEFLQQLRKDNKQSNALLEAFKIVVNKMNEKETTVPRITTLVAILLAKAVQAKLCKLTDIASYTENGQHYPLLLLVLQQLHKVMGKEKLLEIYSESKISLMSSLPEADRTKDRMTNILDDRNLSFLYPMLKLQAEMMKQLQLDPNPNIFYGWIKRNVDSKYYSDPGFIKALMTVVLKYITQETSLTEGIEKSSNKPVSEKEQDLVLKYCNILEAFLNGRSDLQLEALYALQVYCYSLGFPKGILRWWFKSLWEANVIEDDVFLKWKEEINDEYPGKGEALFHVNTWLTWLEQAESEDED